MVTPENGDWTRGLELTSWGFEAPDVLDLFPGLERQLASASGATRDDEPNRPVPERRE